MLCCQHCRCSVAWHLYTFLSYFVLFYCILLFYCSHIIICCWRIRPIHLSIFLCIVTLAIGHSYEYHCPSSREHHSDVIMSAMASQIAGNSILCSTVGSGADQRTRQSSAPMAFVWGIPPVADGSPHKAPVMRKMFPFKGVIMGIGNWILKGIG